MKGFKFKKTLVIILAIVLVIGISAGTAILVDKKSVPAMTTVENGLSAYELAAQYISKDICYNKNDKYVIILQIVGGLFK